MNHLQEIENSIVYIENNLYKSISLDELSARAFCSKYHFQRIFKAAVGETVMEYTRKRRLKKASLLLLKTNKSIRTIAFECGFDFHESFTRAFKNLYGISPEQFRNNKRIFITYEKLELDGKFVPIKPPALSEPIILEQPAYIFIGFEGLIETGEDAGAVLRLWNEFDFRIPEVKNRIDNNSVYAMGFYNTSPHLGYIACVRVSKTERIPKGMESKSIPPLKYAKFTHKGETANITASLNYIFGVWLRDKGCTLANDIDFIIRMDEKYTGDEAFRADIFVPIK